MCADILIEAIPVVVVTHTINHLVSGQLKFLGGTIEVVGKAVSDIVF